MKKIVFTAILGIIAYSGFSQSNTFYKVGDTIYYADNKATYIRTNTFIIIKETNVNKNSNTFKVEKYTVSPKSSKFVLNSKFNTIGLQELRSNGVFTSYHENGKKASEGKTNFGKKGNGIWTYWYKNGEKRSEERLSKETFFNDKIVNLTINFWDDKGNQTVKNGNGFSEFVSDEDGLTHKGSYKDGLKNGVWTAFNGANKVYEEIYKKGKLVKGTSWDLKKKSYSYKKVFADAYYKREGNSNVRKYVARKFNSNTAGISGNILVSFTVTVEGNVGNVIINRGISQDYNSEVKRVLSEMSGWTPAKKRGQSYESTYSLNLHFKD